MKLAVIGSRTFSNRDLLFKCLDPLKDKIGCVVSGGSIGADRLAEAWADDRGLPKKIFPADWGNLDAFGAVVRTHAKTGKPYNVLAGFDRNKDIIDFADVVLAFWDGKSKGTANSIKLAQDQGKPVKIVYI